MEKATIRELSTSVLAELQRLGYAVATIKFYDRIYRRLIRYADENQIHHYSIDIGERWLKQCFGIDSGLVVSKNEGSYRPRLYYPIRACQCLTEWQLHGRLALKKPGKLASREVPHLANHENQTIFYQIK